MSAKESFGYAIIFFAMAFAMAMTAAPIAFAVGLFALALALVAWAAWKSIKDFAVL